MAFTRHRLTVPAGGFDGERVAAPGDGLFVESCPAGTEVSFGDDSQRLPLREGLEYHACPARWSSLLLYVGSAHAGAVVDLIVLDGGELRADGGASGTAGAVSVADGADVAQGAKGDAAVTDPASAASVVALLKGLLTVLAEVDANTDTLEALLAGTLNVSVVSGLTLTAADDAVRAYVPAEGVVDAAGAAVALKFAPINVATVASHVIVPAAVGKKIRVLNYTLVAAAAVGVQWLRGATVISGELPLAANGGAAPSGSVLSPLMETAAGEALVLALDTAAQVSGHLCYIEV